MTTETEAPPIDEPEKLEGITPEPLVDLDAKKKRQDDGEQLLRFEGKLYRIRALDEFGIVKRQHLDRDGREFYKLYENENEPTDTDDQRLEMLVDRIFDGAVEAPASVKKKIGPADKVDVVLGFTQAPLLKVMAAARAIQEQMQETAREAESQTTGS